MRFVRTKKPTLKQKTIYEWEKEKETEQDSNSKWFHMVWFEEYSLWIDEKKNGSLRISINDLNSDPLWEEKRSSRASVELAKLDLEKRYIAIVKEAAQYAANLANLADAMAMSFALGLLGFGEKRVALENALIAPPKMLEDWGSLNSSVQAVSEINFAEFIRQLQKAKDKTAGVLEHLRWATSLRK